MVEGTIHLRTAVGTSQDTFLSDGGVVIVRQGPFSRLHKRSLGQRQSNDGQRNIIVVGGSNNVSIVVGDLPLFLNSGWRITKFASQPVSHIEGTCHSKESKISIHS